MVKSFKADILSISPFLLENVSFETLYSGQLILPNEFS